MNPLARRFYTRGAQFQEVLFLENDLGFDWTEISEKCPDLPRGWFELSRVLPQNRVEFVLDAWLDFLPFHPIAHSQIVDFFSQLDDLSIAIVRQDDILQPEMVYSLSDNSTFFRGLPPATDEDIREFISNMGVSLPRDYLSFLRIHNGFGKRSEMGVLRIEDIDGSRQRVKNLLQRDDRVVRSGGKIVEPTSLIPFYETLGMESFQCFYADWYPTSEMGNVYLSGIDYTISDTRDRKAWTERLAFPTFIEWLAYYLEGMNLSL